MDIKAIGTKILKPLSLESQGLHGGVKKSNDTQADVLKNEIEQTKTEIKKHMEEVQVAAGESISGGSDRVQLLQNTIAMQQQAIALKQMQIDKIEEPRFDEYSHSKEDAAKKPDNVYRLEFEDDKMRIIFNRFDEGE